MLNPASTTPAALGEADASPTATAESERRISGRRVRARDRLLDRGSQPTAVPSGTLSRVRDIENTVSEIRRSVNLLIFIQIEYLKVSW